MEEAQLSHLSSIGVDDCPVGFEKVLCKLVDFFLIFLASAFYKTHALHPTKGFALPLSYFDEVVLDDVVFLEDGHPGVLVGVHTIERL